MVDRIDVLGFRPERLAALRGQALDGPSDPALDAITREAADDLGAATGVISFILDRLQLFRASHGLGSPSSGQAIDRDLSICQYVVRDREVVAIPDTLLDPRVPELAVRAFGVRSYLGAPVRVGDEVVGSLCIYGLQPREFSDRDREVLTRHAGRVTARLAELAAEQRGKDGAAALLRAATRPAFQDLRNAIWQLSTSLDEIRIAAFEASKLSAFTAATVTLPGGSAEGLPLLSSATRAAAELVALTDGAQRSADRLQQSLLALEAATQRTGSTADLGSAVMSAARLSDHFVKLVGSLTGAPPPGITVEMPASSVIVQVSTALATLALALLKARVTGALLLSAEEKPERVTLRIATLGMTELHAAVAAEVRGLLGPSAGVMVGSDATSISLAYRPAAAP